MAVVVVVAMTVFVVTTPTVYGEDQADGSALPSSQDDPTLPCSQDVPKLPTSQDVSTQPSSQDASTPPTSQEYPSVPDREEEPGGMPSLSIEDSGRYEGMGRSYYNGYLPSIAGGYATIVLPLIAEGEIASDRITVTPQLGATERSPFVYRNYQRSFEEKEFVPLDGGEAVRMYLVCIELELSEDRYDGVYPVVLTVAGQSTSGAAFSQIFTSYVTITDGKSTEPVVEKPVVPEVTKPESQPLLYVSSYSVIPRIPVAGEPFSVTVSVRNTSKAKAVRNMAIQVSCDSPELTLQEDSSTIYWERLEADSTRELTLHFKAESGIMVGRYNISLDMSFDNEDAMTLSASGSVPVTVTQPMILDAVYPEMADHVSAGDTVSMTFQAVNLGKSRAYNVRFELDAAGLIPNGLAYVGNHEAGSSGNAEMKVFIGSKDMNRTLDKTAERYGSTSGTLTMIYEGENGNEFREEHPVATNIEELVIGPHSEEEPEKPNSSQWGVALGIGAVVAAGLTGWLVYRNNTKRSFRTGKKRTNL